VLRRESRFLLRYLRGSVRRLRAASIVAAGTDSRMAGVSMPLSARVLERAPTRVGSRPAGPVALAGDDLSLRYATDRARTVCRHLPFAVVAFLVTYAGVAVFELWRSPHRFWLYAMIYALGAAYCALAVALTRAPDVPPARVTTLTTLVGVLLVVNTSAYHIIGGGEAEVLALGNLYLVIGFLTAFPLGGGPQLVVALTGCAGLLIALGTTASAAVDAGILVTGMVSLCALSVAGAVFGDRQRRGFFEAREELEAAKEAAEAASHARRDFVASVSHDLRTPVNIIFGMADMALDVAVSDEQRDFVATIKRSAGQLHALINDLLDFSKMDAGIVDLRPRPFALRPWLEQTLAPHAAEAAAKQVALETAVDAAVAEIIVADPDRLAQVIGNLAGNAVKFTERGTVRVSVAAERAGAGVRLRCRVADSGCGIAADELTRLFQPFSQAAAATRSSGGSGLGLAICRRLVEQMGGTIGVDSVLGRGSTFWFTLPLAA
jgi:signal transduction histidine kinase